MSLEKLYNDAATSTYVGVVRTRQSSAAPQNQTLVNYLDGTTRDAQNIPDQFQKEFTRNNPGTFKSGGAQGVERNPQQSYTRWTNKSFKIAFDGEGPSTLSRGYYIDRFRKDSNNNLVHLYTPRNGTRFVDKDTSARNKINMSPSGAPTF